MSLLDKNCPLDEWTSSATEVLLNPWMPEPQRSALLAVPSALPPLPGHVWITTSGSSGIKWVALSKTALLASAQAVNEHLESSSRDLWALALPTFHVGGLGILARGALSGAAVRRFMDTGKPLWNARAFHAFLSETGATLTALVPTQIHDLVRDALPSPKSLRAVVIGGGAFTPELYRAARALGWPVLPSYGLSECCSQVATAPLSSLAAQADDDPMLRLLPHVAVRVSPEGRFLLRSPSLLTGYGLPGALPDGPQFVDPKVDGWFLTEDRGSLEDRTLRVQGRIGDFVKIGGESVDAAHLAQLWARLQSGRDLPETVLTTAADARLGAAIHVIAAGDAEQQPQIDEVIAEFNRQVLPFERVQQMHWVREIPRSPLGKLLRKELLALAGLRSV